MDRREQLELIVKICERAEEMGIAPDERITLIMDLENAHKDVGMDFAGLLAADDGNFGHDIIGIQRHMNRDTHQLEDFFLPRYAQQKGLGAVIDDAQAAAKESEAETDKGPQERSQDKCDTEETMDR